MSSLLDQLLSQRPSLNQQQIPVASQQPVDFNKAVASGGLTIDKPKPSLVDNVVGGVKKGIDYALNQGIINNPIPGGKPLGPKIRDTIPPLIQAPFRAAETVRASSVNPNFPAETPKGPIGTALLGKEPITNIPSRVKKGVDIPLVNKNISGAAAIPLVVGGLAADLFPLAGGAEKTVAEEAVKLVKSASTIEDFSKLFQSAKPEVKALIQKRIADKGINTVEDFYKYAKNEPIAKQAAKPLLDTADAKLIPELSKKFDTTGLSVEETAKIEELRNKYGILPNQSAPTNKILSELGGMLDKNQSYAFRELPKTTETPSATLNGVPPAGTPPLPPEDPINKVITALKGAKDIRKEQNILNAQELAKRTAKITNIGTQVTGEERLMKQLGALKGGFQKADITPVKGLTKEDVNVLLDKVDASPALRPFEKISGQTALLDLFKGKLPAESQLEILNQVFPPEFTKAILDNRTNLQKTLGLTAEVLNVPRALMSSADFSAGLRQAVFAAPSHPIRFAQAFAKQFKYALSEKAFQEGQKAIVNDPLYLLSKDHGLAITNTGNLMGGREEAFAADLAERIPGIGRVVRGSERAYVGLLNDFRFNLWKDMVKNGETLGLGNDQKFLHDTAQLINNMTGRGNLPDWAKGAAPIANAVFFSPRLMASRLSLLNPVNYVKMQPQVRKEALKSLFAFLALGGTVLGLAKLNGAEVSSDATSADFGKIKTGNTRLDIWGGFQQYVRLGAVVSNLLNQYSQGKRPKFGEATALDKILQFGQNKTNPIFSLGVNILRDSNSVGQPLDFKTLDPTQNEIMQRFVPLFVQDLRDLYTSDPNSVPLIIPGLFGVGTQTYAPKPPKARALKKSKINIGTRIQ